MSDRMAMVDMSRAIRTTIEQHGGTTLTALDDGVLVALAEIVGAFAVDLRLEVERRGL